MELHPEIAEHYAQGVERKRLATWGQVRRATVLRTIARIESGPTVPGASPHLMAVAAAP
jgi:hypothetical protein